MKFYLSGRITGLTQHEFTMNFRRGAHVVMERYEDAEVINPTEVKVCDDPRCGGGATLDNGNQLHAYHCYMKHDIKEMLDCDAIVMLPDWDLSSGATFEREVAIKCGLHVFYITRGYEGLIE